jgi:hypothetical protein
MTQEQKQQLIDLSWRYAVLIGVVACEGVVAEEVAPQDRKRWARLIKKSLDGLPAFHEPDAVTFVHEMSGLPEPDCLLVLRQQWMEELCTNCTGLLHPIKDGGVIDGKHMLRLKCELCTAQEVRMLECLINSCPWCER